MVLARRLLKDDGVIFVSLDDNMQAYFKVMMDEVFGEKNFVGCFPRKTVASGKNDERKIGLSHDYVITYSSISDLSRNNDYDKSAYKNKDERGAYISRELDMSSLPYQKSLDYPVSFRGKTYNPGETINKRGSVCWR
jgi:adenine-specific DNA-methyltransferase